MLKIESVRMAKDHEWDAFYEATPHATYFHSREWTELWDRATRGRLQSWPRLVTFVDGERALLPMSVGLGAGGLVRSYDRVSLHGYTDVSVHADFCLLAHHGLGRTHHGTARRQ